MMAWIKALENLAMRPTGPHGHAAAEVARRLGFHDVAREFSRLAILLDNGVVGAAVESRNRAAGLLQAHSARAESNTAKGPTPARAPAVEPGSPLKRICPTHVSAVVRWSCRWCPRADAGVISKLEAFGARVTEAIHNAAGANGDVRIDDAWTSHDAVREGGETEGADVTTPISATPRTPKRTRIRWVRSRSTTYRPDDIPRLEAEIDALVKKIGGAAQHGGVLEVYVSFDPTLAPARPSKSIAIRRRLPPPRPPSLLLDGDVIESEVLDDAAAE